MDTTYQPPNRMHRLFSCGEAAEARALLGLTRGWADTFAARPSARLEAVTVTRREQAPARLRGPVFGRKVVA